MFLIASCLYGNRDNYELLVWVIIQIMEVHVHVATYCLNGSLLVGGWCGQVVSRRVCVHREW